MGAHRARLRPATPGPIRGSAARRPRGGCLPADRGTWSGDSRPRRRAPSFRAGGRAAPCSSRPAGADIGDGERGLDAEQVHHALGFARRVARGLVMPDIGDDPRHWPARRRKRLGRRPRAAPIPPRDPPQEAAPATGPRARSASAATSLYSAAARFCSASSHRRNAAA